MPIHRLSQSLINKIAAGEVIERPASVIKELMENAVDAGATRIDVAAAGGGLDLMRVTDNGGGIPAEELPLAVAPHATSKLSEADDLFRVGTLGFRGEALASIGEVSRLVIRSRTAARPGWGGNRSLRRACRRGRALRMPGGHDRRGAQPLLQHAGAAEVHAHPADRVRPHQRGLHADCLGPAAGPFHLAAQRAAGIRPAGASEIPVERIAALFGRELAERLIFVESSDGDVRISGCVAHPSQSRSNNRMQYLFLNGRHIRDHALQHALGEAYRGLLMVGRYAIAFLSIEMPPDMVDVNVHPTKLEVRFRDGGRLYSQLLSTLRSKFLTTDLTTQAQAPPRRRGSQRRARRDAGGPIAAGAGRLGQGQGGCLAAAGRAARNSGGLPAADEPWARSEPLKQYSFPASDMAAERRPLELTRLDPLRPAFQPPAEDFAACSPRRKESPASARCGRSRRRRDRPPCVRRRPCKFTIVTSSPRRERA